MADWVELVDGRFKDVVFHYAVPKDDKVHGISTEEIADERRLQMIERPFVNGAVINDLGGRAKQYSVEVHFFGPNYAKLSDEFEKLLDQGTAGKLILPTIRRPVLAYYQKRSVSSRYDDGSAKTMHVTWIGTEVSPKLVDATEKALLSHASVSETASSAAEAISSAKSILQDNPFLSAVRTFESGLSSARRFSNTILTLKNGVVKRIQSIEANISGTLDLMSEAIGSIRSLLSPESTAGSASHGDTLNLVDSVTGNPIADYSDPDTLPTPKDPLANSGPTPVLPVSRTNVESEAGAERLIAKIVSGLKDNRDSLQGLTLGHTDDVAVAINVVITRVNDFMGSVLTKSSKQVVVPVTMSLNEVLFLNGINPSKLRQYHKMNTHIDDIVVIPAGTVVNL